MVPSAIYGLFLVLESDASGTFDDMGKLLFGGLLLALLLAVVVASLMIRQQKKKETGSGFVSIGRNNEGKAQFRG